MKIQERKYLKYKYMVHTLITSTTGKVIETERLINNFADKGWRLIAVSGNIHYFECEVFQGCKKADEPKDRKRGE